MVSPVCFFGSRGRLPPSESHIPVDMLLKSSNPFADASWMPELGNSHPSGSSGWIFHELTKKACT